MGSEAAPVATLRDWKDEIQRHLRAIKMAIKSTVEIADDDWFADIDSILELGKKPLFPGWCFYK
jgi:hypothetical protein